jgi:MFS transporter, DHA1 family, inner membrane transport protein
MPNTTQRNFRVPELLILALGIFTLSVDRYLLTGLLPQVSGDLHVSASAVGQLATLFGLVYAMSSPLLAAVTATWERRVLLATGMAVFLAGIGLQATAAGYPIVAAGSVIAGLGAAAYQPTAYSSAGLLSDHGTRARSLSIVAGGASCALILGVPLAIWVGQLWGWRASLLTIAALAAGAIIPLGVLAPVYAPPMQQGRWQVLADHRVFRMMAVTAVVMAPNILVVTYLPIILHASGSLVPVAMLAFGGGGFVGTAVVPLLVSWHGARFSLLVGACGGTGFATLLIAARLNQVGAAATLFALGVGGALTIVPQQHRLIALVPAAAAPVAIGLNGSALFVGGALGAAIGGAVLAAWGTGALLPATVGLGLISIMLCAVVRPEAREHVAALRE